MSRSTTKHVIRNSCTAAITCAANSSNLIGGTICGVIEESYTVLRMELCITSWTEPCAATNNCCSVVLNKGVVDMKDIRNRSNVNCATLIICCVIDNFASIKSCISRCNINTSTNTLITKLVGVITGGLVSVNRTTVHGEASTVDIWPVIPWCSSI